MADDTNGIEMKDDDFKTTAEKQADPDAIRMFVGQIPRHWTEEELVPLFEEYGDIHKLVVLKDREKGIGTNRGCCFVTYCTRRSALEAQIALHGVRTLPGVKYPVQMKPADNDPSKNTEDRKLFIGMVSKKYSEEELRKLFSSYGTIEECVILRDFQGNSRGCAFVQFNSRQSCINAIRGLNRSQVMEGCSGPLTVKFAETAKQKEMKKLGQSAAVGGQSFFGSGTSNFTAGNQQRGYLSTSTSNTPASSMFGNFSSSNFSAAQPTNAPTDPQQQLLLLALTAIGQSSAATAGPLLSALGSMPNMGTLNNLSNLNPQVLQALATLVQPNQSQQTIASAAATIVNALSVISNSPSGYGAASTSAISSNVGQNSSLNQAMSMLSAAAGVPSNQMASLLSAFQQTQVPPPPPPPPVMPPQSSNQPTETMYSPTASVRNTAYSGDTNVNATQIQTNPSGSAGLNLGNNASSIDIDSFTQAFLQGVNQYAQSHASNQLGSGNAPTSAPKSSGGKQSEGPEGANLFIYHIPQEFTDADLSAAFSPFGTVISAKVFVDKLTNMSKCFGFVSYDNEISAQNAIQNMNGFTIGRKKLRVQLKRDNTKPY